MAPNKIIIDTDPGVDDIMAMLMALSAQPEELEVLMLSVTYGNVPLQSCLKNVVALFHVLEKEIEWRKSQGRPEGFAGMRKNKPIVAVGPEHPLDDEELMADYFHGLDGLHNVHDAHPHLSPADTWRALFDKTSDAAPEVDNFSPYFTPSKTPSHKEILRILKENPADTVSVLAVGPLTNVALAAAEDPETFLKIKELVVMGGAVHVEGNCTPTAEFNCYADAVAAARVYALTSPNPSSTMPIIPAKGSTMPAYPEKLSRPLRLVLCPLDITTPHGIDKKYFSESIKPYLEARSPLAQWTSHFIMGAFGKIGGMGFDDSELELSLHDPLTVWYAMTCNDPAWKLTEPEDIRVETAGQWTRGMHVIDRRGRERKLQADVTGLEEIPGDDDGWLHAHKGNRIYRVVGSPGDRIFKEVWLKQVFA